MYCQFRLSLPFETQNIASLHNFNFSKLLGFLESLLLPRFVSGQGPLSIPTMAGWERNKVVSDPLAIFWFFAHLSFANPRLRMWDMRIFNSPLSSLQRIFVYSLFLVPFTNPCSPIYRYGRFGYS